VRVGRTGSSFDRGWPRYEPGLSGPADRSRLDRAARSSWPRMGPGRPAPAGRPGPCHSPSCRTLPEQTL